MTFTSVRIAIAKWLQYVIIIFCIGGFSYAGMQQMYRSSLNDPQIEIVEAAQIALYQGATPQQIVPPNQTDLTLSLSPFIAVYNASGVPQISSATFANALPTPPQEFFITAKEVGENRVIWQADESTRIALVVRPVTITATGEEAYVLAGRSAREVDARSERLANMAFSAIALALVLTLLLELFGAWRHGRALAHKPVSPQHVPPTPPTFH